MWACCFAEAHFKVLSGNLALKYFTYPVTRLNRIAVDLHTREVRVSYVCVLSVLNSLNI